MLSLHQEQANCCWEDGAGNGLRTKHSLDLRACTAAGGSSCSFPGCTKHTHTHTQGYSGTEGQSSSSGTREQAREKELVWEKHVLFLHHGKKTLYVKLRHNRLVLK